MLVTPPGPPPALGVVPVTASGTCSGNALFTLSQTKVLCLQSDPALTCTPAGQVEAQDTCFLPGLQGSLSSLDVGRTAPALSRPLVGHRQAPGSMALVPTVQPRKPARSSAPAGIGPAQPAMSPESSARPLLPSLDAPHPPAPGSPPSAPTPPAPVRMHGSSALQTPPASPGVPSFLEHPQLSQ